MKQKWEYFLRRLKFKLKPPRPKQANMKPVLYGSWIFFKKLSLCASQDRDNNVTLEHTDAIFVYTCCKPQWLNPCFAPLPSQGSKLPGHQHLAIFHISWSSSGTLCLQSLPCENDKLKWYMCGLTCTAQESLGWITLLCLCVCIEHVVSLGVSWGAGLGGAPGTTLSPTHLPPWVAAPRISARGAWMSFVTPSILLHFLLQVWFFLYCVYC